MRLGRLVAPPEIVEATWRRHEYATIATGMLSMRLGELALEPSTRDRLLARTRRYIRGGYAHLEAWIGANADLLSIVPPEATTLGFVRHHLDLASVEVAHALRREADVLVAPGSTCGVEQHLRITHGLEPALLDEAFDRAGRVLRGWQRGADDRAGIRTRMPARRSGRGSRTDGRTARLPPARRQFVPDGSGAVAGHCRRCARWRMVARCTRSGSPLTSASRFGDRGMTSTFGRLIVRVAGGREEYALAAAVVTLGRSSASDVVLADPRVSRTHARVECGAEGCRIVDLGSANGTNVNGRRVERAELQHGDTITLGDTILWFETTPTEPLPDVTTLETSSDIDQTLADATVPIRLNDATHPRLAVHTREGTWEVPLDAGSLTVGRDPGSDIVLADAGVSRHHARVERVGGATLLRDLGSTNGTWLGSDRVDEVVLRPGRTIRIGGARLAFKPGVGPDDLTIVESRPAAGGRRPVVVVPGLMGSELWRGSERVWPNPRLLLSDPGLFRLPDRTPLRAGSIVREVVIVPNLVSQQAYSRLTEYLVDGLGYEGGRDVLEFGYDWRQDVRDSAGHLAQAVEGWHVAGPITIVAHSLGCLVSRYYVERLGGDRRVGRLICMGGPHTGTPKALAGLVLGPRILPFGLLGDRLRDVAATFPSAYQILPTYACVLDQQERPVDVIEDDAWIEQARRPLLREAQSFWAELGTGSKVPTTSVFGYGTRTTTGLRVTRDERLGWRRLELVNGPNGDGTVPAASALLEGSEMHPVHQDHGALYVDSDVRMRLKLELTVPEDRHAGGGDR